MQPSAAKKLTPVMRQYEEAKHEHSDAIVFFRLGDFYEMFRDDAVIASRELGLTLTSRNKGDVDEVPMAGVPHHAAHGYIAKLLERGFKVALCEQMADPSKVKGIVPRQVVRVLTPGLVTEADQLEAKENHYLAVIDGALAESRIVETSIALLDLSTGELSVSVASEPSVLLAELNRSTPREVLFASELSAMQTSFTSLVGGSVMRSDAPLEDSEIERIFEDAVDGSLYKEAAEQHSIVALRAAARALRFARRCSPEVKLPVARIAPLDLSQTLRIDETAQKHLELVQASDGSKRGTLMDVLDATMTPAGGRLLRKRLLLPLYDVAAIRRRLDAVELFVTHTRARQELRTSLEQVADLERLAVRALMREITPREMGALRDSLLAMPGVVSALASIPDSDAATLLETDVDTVTDLATLLSRALVDRPPPLVKDRGIVREGYDTELDELRAMQKEGTEYIVSLENKLREETSIGSLRVKFTRVFGWYIEVTKTHVGKVPQSWRRKQTIAGGERYTCEELDALADKLENAESRFEEREKELYEFLSSEVAKASPRIRLLAARLAAWDVASSLAEVAHRNDYARPEVDASDVLIIREGRHPVVEKIAAAGCFVPNDTTLDLNAERLWLVTGPNMAGKSTLMRQVALIVILAQMGSYVPAKYARVGLVDRVLSRVGASDNVARGESTFMVEMRETASILKEATRRSLVILDEIGRGTSTFDGLSIAWAVTEYLHDAVGCRSMFATHYHELTELSKTCPNIANYSVSAKEYGDNVIFLHRIVRGAASRSYGIAVARLAGLPEVVLARSKAILASLESGNMDAASKRRSKTPSPQLDLFAPKQDANQEIVETLRHLDVDRLTPIDALGLLSRLKQKLSM